MPEETRVLNGCPELLDDKQRRGQGVKVNLANIQVRLLQVVSNDLGLVVEEAWLAVRLVVDQLAGQVVETTISWPARVR